MKRLLATLLLATSLAANAQTTIGTDVGEIDNVNDLAGALCGTNEILEDQGGTWACIATPSGGGSSHSNGANCAAGEIPLGVDANGAVEGCYEPTEADITDLSHTVDTDTQLSEEQVEDFAGGMLNGTETRITVTYDDVGNAINFVVDDMNDDVPESGDFGAATDLNAAGEVIGGDADTSAALAANGANCAAGNFPLGVDAAGAAESCTADDDVPESGDFGAAADLTSTGALDTGVIDALNLLAGALCGTNQILEDQGATWACINTPSGGGGGGDSSSADILVGTASSSGNNLAGADGAEVDISWDASTNDTGEVTSFTNGDTEVQITNAGEIRVQAAVAVIDAGLNNRQTYGLSINHLNSSDVLQYQYWLGSFYVRDDNNTYDSGLAAGQVTINVAASDKIQVEVEVLDAQTTTGTVNASTTYSTIKIEKITH